MEPKLSGKQFEIALSMAGAISAGAYTGGVFDFLIQALDEWEKARSDDNLGASIPNHRAGIKAMSGASAGAITGAVGAIAINGGLKPELFKSPPPSSQTIKFVFPNLYRAWVVQPCLVSKVGEEDFLSTSDIAKDSSVTSLLNSKLLGLVCDGALKIGKPEHPPAAYIAHELHVYMTLTNMRGVPYSISFKGGDYGMMSYGDRRYYKIVGSGSWTSASRSPFTEDDVGTTLTAQDLFSANQSSPAWKEFGTASLASGAFPLGLAPVPQNVSATDYVGRKWPIDNLQKPGQLAVAWPKPSAYFPGAEAKGQYGFVSIDGGVINNEPFEYARFALMKDPPAGNLRAGDEADRAVIMIDPFPESPDFPRPGSPDAGIVSIVAALFPMLKTQARFKPSELMLAGAEDVYSRFLIGPHRTLPGAKKEEAYAIACGLLGGFGGFLAQEFRDHDYQLGRRNCQRFLRQVFTLPASNDIIKNWPQSARDNPGFRTSQDPNLPVDPAYVPEYTIIPLLGSATPEVVLPPWPQLSQRDFDALQPRIKTRFNAVAAKLVADKAPKSIFVRLSIRALLFFGKGKILDFIESAILSDLVRRNQIENWAVPTTWKKPVTPLPEDIACHAVWAELLNPSYDFFTEAGIAATTKLPPDTVHAVLLMSQAEDDKPFTVWTPSWKGPNGVTLYALTSRKPGLLGRLPVTRNIGDWLSSPDIN